MAAPHIVNFRDLDATITHSTSDLLLESRGCVAAVSDRDGTALITKEEAPEAETNVRARQ
jgi:hypothetical protein